LDTMPRSPNGFLSSLSADDFELIRPHLKSVDLVQDLVLVAVGDALKRAYLPHRGVISLVVDLARGEHVQVAMIGRHSIFGVFSALGDPVALNSAIVMVPGPASTIDLDRLRAIAEKSATLRSRCTRRSSRRRAATHLTPWNPAWRDACCRPTTSPAVSSCC
jgi:CRP-like cAMP-binding protein